jgi:hypothetical protein
MVACFWLLVNNLRYKTVMKKLSILIFVVIFVFSALGFAEQYPMLEDIRQVSVIIDHAGVEPNVPPIDWAGLNLQIKRKLNSVGIQTAPILGRTLRSADTPELRITVMMLSMPETEQFVFHIETSLHRLVSIAEKSNVQFSSPVWTSSVAMQSTSVDDVNDAIAKAAMRQVEVFINAHHIAIIKPTNTPDANTPKKLAGNSLAPLPVMSQPAAATSQTYIASKSSKVFHLSTCAAAKTISPENLITFASRQEALAGGRRPCKKCNP